MTVLLQAARYRAANARVHGLLPQTDLTRRMGGVADAPDLPTLLMLLRDTSYGPVLPVPSAAEPDAIQVERALAQRLTEAARLPFTLLQAPRELLEWFWRRFEVDNLKTVVRGVHHQAPPSQVQAALIALGPTSVLPWSTW